VRRGWCRRRDADPVRQVGTAPGEHLGEGAYELVGLIQLEQASRTALSWVDSSSVRVSGWRVIQPTAVRADGAEIGTRP
jgi:hypothetical protein